ncbi:MAG: NADPH-dependent glutamate synthase [Oscillospiraceae bacterium]|jgi:glutamate synthase (NADPH/NADH) small chain|nr:NADPH-dependent glutamate synthase [Oscillospiraceae bacterium]
MANQQKIPMREQPPQERRRNFSEAALGYTPEQAKREASRCLGCNNRPCVAGCPVSVPIPEFLALTAKGNYAGAYDAVYAQNTLPAVCGRVCPQERQCEALCVRGIKGEPVGVGRVERFVADWHDEQSRLDDQPAVRNVSQKREKVAIVGSGPAGLTCSGELARRGYAVTVFEAFHEPGGVLTYGIPEFRLPKAVVRREIENLRGLGVTFEVNAVIGRLFTVDELFARGYAAVFLGVGAGLPVFMGIPGENLNGVYSANEFLTRVNLMKAYLDEADTPVQKGKRVVVVGGGNVAMDAARCALRLGAEEVRILYRRSAEELPARAEEVFHAREEGVVFDFLSAPAEYLPDGQGRVRAAVCQRMELSEPDGSGRRKPVPVAGERYTVDCDMAIVAIGTTPNPLVAQTTEGLELNGRGCILTDSVTCATSRSGVYAGGDIATGAATVILAMGAGKKAAAAMDAYISAHV